MTIGQDCLVGIGAEAVQALVDGRHGDPFSILGPHSRSSMSIVRARAGRSSDRRGRARRFQPPRPPRARPSRRPFRRFGGRPPPLPPAHRVAQCGSGDGRPIQLRSSARRARSASDRRGHALRARTLPRGPGDDDRRRQGRTLCRLGAQRAPCVRCRRLQHPGTADDIRCACAARRASGSCSFHATDRERSTNTSSSVPTERCSRRRPIPWRDSEASPGTASIVASSEPFVWTDEAWIADRARRQNLDAPMSFYEVHAGSWLRIVEEGFRSLTWTEMGEHSRRPSSSRSSSASARGSTSRPWRSYRRRVCLAREELRSSSDP